MERLNSLSIFMDLLQILMEVVGYQGLNYQVDQPFKDTLEALDKALMGHFEINKGKWGFSDIQYVKTEEKRCTPFLLHYPPK
jgi:hypothetical protein